MKAALSAISESCPTDGFTVISKVKEKANYSW
jgi:hypothetical protein